MSEGLSVPTGEAPFDASSTDEWKMRMTRGHKTAQREALRVVDDARVCSLLTAIARRYTQICEQAGKQANRQAGRGSVSPFVSAATRTLGMAAGGRLPSGRGSGWAGLRVLHPCVRACARASVPDIAKYSRAVTSHHWPPDWMLTLRAVLVLAPMPQGPRARVSIVSTGRKVGTQG